jgi:hypothetical protein
VNTHRYVVISDPCSHPADDVVFVNFTTFRAGADATCVVTPAEYSDLGHDSCIAYGEVRAVALSTLQTLVASTGRAFSRMP